MGQMWRRMLGSALLPNTREGLWHPAVNICNSDDRIAVEVELPGMKNQDIDVSVREQHLLIQGSRPPSEWAEQGESYHTERATGRFPRIIHLPVDVDAEATGARYEDGILTVTMAKRRREGGRRIEIT